MASFTAKNIFSSFKSTGVHPFNLDVILNRFIDNSSDTLSNTLSVTPIYSGDTWIKLDTVAKQALAGALEKNASVV